MQHLPPVDEGSGSASAAAVSATEGLLVDGGSRSSIAR